MAEAYKQHHHCQIIQEKEDQRFAEIKEHKGRFQQQVRSNLPRRKSVQTVSRNGKSGSAGNSTANWGSIILRGFKIAIPELL